MVIKRCFFSRVDYILSVIYVNNLKVIIGVKVKEFIKFFTYFLVAK